MSAPAGIGVDPAPIVEALLRLQPEVAEFRACCRELCAVRGCRQIELAAAATRRTSAAQIRLTRTLVTLKRYVLTCDGEGTGTAESIEEWAIRAGLHVVARCMCELETVLHDPGARLRARAMFVGRFHDAGIDVVARFVHDEVTQVSRLWGRYRAPGTGAGEDRPGSRATLHRSTIRVAQRAIRDLGRDPDLAAFLREGCARTSGPATGTACALMRSAIDAIDALPAIRALLAPTSTR